MILLFKNRLLKIKAVVMTVMITSFLFVAPVFAATPSYTNPKVPKLTELQSLTFNSATITVNGKRFNLASKDFIALRFEDKMVTINAGCNTLNGKYSLSTGILRAQTLFSSKMACTEKLMDQDVWLNQLFSSKPKLTIQYVTSKSKVKSPAVLLTLTSNLAPGLKTGKTIIKMNLSETYGYADTPLGDENSTALVKATCKQLLFSKATELQAQFAAEQNALRFRVIAREGENFMVTEDYIINRLNVAILDGKVSACSQG